MFTDTDVISAYTTQDALADGSLVDARTLEGDAGQLVRERYNKSPVYLSRRLNDLIQRAVDNPRACNDWSGVLWDILWMSRHAVNQAVKQAQQHGSGYESFTVTITGTGRRRRHLIEVAVTAEGLTFMLPGDR